MRYAVTGVTEVKECDYRVVRDVLRRLRNVEEFSTGGAHGIDSIACVLALAMYPEAKHRIVVPAAPHNEELVKSLGGMVEVLYAPQGGNVSKSYMLRNELLVRQCDVLLAFPRTNQMTLRSGTWATVRRAQSAKKEVRVRALHGAHRE